MLDFAILGILTDGPLHGYELKRVLADSEHGFWTVSFGSLYPALRRLEKKGFVSVGTDGGPRRKVYQLTAGRQGLFPGAPGDSGGSRRGTRLHPEAVVLPVPRPRFTPRRARTAPGPSHHPAGRVAQVDEGLGQPHKTADGRLHACPDEPEREQHRGRHRLVGRIDRERAGRPAQAQATPGTGNGARSD